jgi:hypothetical protein
MARNGEVSAGRTGAAPAKPLLELIRAERGILSPHRRALGGEGLLAKWRHASVARRSRTLALAVAAAVVLAVAVFGWERSRTPALSYAVEGGHVEREGLIAADRPVPPVIRFSDGSEVALGIATQARLRSVDPEGACIALTDGSAHVDVVHGRGTRWIFEAGPFLITVTGTAFTLGWTAAEESLAIRMDRGSVEVSGPLADGPIVLRSGQQLTVHVRERETVIREGAAVPVAADDERAPDPKGVEPASVDASAPDLPGAEPNDVDAARPTSVREGVAAEHWATELAAGRFAAIVRQAERRGIETCLAGANVQDLSALADAARYARRDDVARRALLAEQHRFPGSAEARDATFLLGRLDEANGDASGALALYGHYVAENPSATYASEALGRRMSLTRRLFGDARARPLAEEYLLRFPQGTYSASARSLRGTR